MLYRPGAELLNLSPDTLGPLLFDDIPFLEEAQREHDAFAQLLRDEGVEVLYLDELVAEALDAAPGARAAFCERWIDESGLAGRAARQAVRELLDDITDTRALVRRCIAGVRVDELGLSPARAASLADLVLTDANASTPLAIDPIPNIYFTRDTFSVIGAGASVNRMLTTTRRRESIFGEFVLRHHPVYGGAPLWYTPEAPYHIEGGDILVLGPDVVGVGISERTSAAAVDVLAHRLLWGGTDPSGGERPGQSGPGAAGEKNPAALPDSGIRRVMAFSIPHKRSFMHLDTVFTQVDVDTFTVHPGILGTLHVFELTRGARPGEVTIRELDESLDVALARALGLDAVRLIKCGGDDAIAAAREQWNDGSNTLAVRPGRVLVYQRNAVTNDILARAGVELLEVPSAELSRGRGGPHCMSMAFWRDAL
nr:arginine deiminase family protein [Olsenella profusa]